MRQSVWDQRYVYSWSLSKIREQGHKTMANDVNNSEYCPWSFFCLAVLPAHLNMRVASGSIGLARSWLDDPSSPKDLTT